MEQPLVSIIMRSYNEAWALGDTLAALQQQTYAAWELIVIDSGSTDGSQAMIEAAHPAHFIQIQPHEYNPGRVMNQGMRLAKSEWCLFINADATPQGTEWLGELVHALQEQNVAAVFSRQIPRPDCEAVFASDYERCFGDGRESATWEHFFSMVSSGLRKSVWALRGFREDIQYAEDDEYTRWCRDQGYTIRYVPTSVAMHSHNYSSTQAHRRAFGDAKALGQAALGNPSKFNWLRTVMLGSLSDLRHDLRYCLKRKRLHELPHAMRIRWSQRRGRLQGFRAGWAEQAMPPPAAAG
jgi:rhamnosyltransferase